MERIVLKPKTPQLDGKDLDDLCDLYLAELEKRVSDISHYGFGQKLSYFRKFWRENGEKYNFILTPNVLQDFAAWLAVLKTDRTKAVLSWNSQHDAIRRFRGLMKWAFHNGYVSSDWSKYCPSVRGKPSPHETLPLLDMRAIFDQCLMSSNHLRDCALLAVLAGTGVRRNECSHIKCNDVVFVESLSGLIKIREGKGGRYRQVAFDSVAGRFIKFWINRHPDTNGYLFPGRFGGDRPAKNESLNRILQVHAAAAGVDFDGCHQLRRTFATSWALRLPGEGYDGLLSKQLGHSVKGMTFGTYVKLTAEDIRKVMVRTGCSAFAQMLA